MARYFNKNLKFIRQQMNISQQELGEYLNTTSQTISRYESGILEANQNVLFKLADFFGISINEFFPPLNFDNATPIDINSNIIKIPVYGTIKAGIPIESQNEIVDILDNL